MAIISNQGLSPVIKTVATGSLEKTFYTSSEPKNVYDLIVKGILPLDYQAPATPLVFSIKERLQSMHLEIDQNQQTEKKNIKLIKKAETPLKNYEVEVNTKPKN